MAVIGAGSVAKRLALTDILKLINTGRIKPRRRDSRKRRMHTFGQSSQPLLHGGQAKEHNPEPRRPQIRADGPAAWSTLPTKIIGDGRGSDRRWVDILTSNRPVHRDQHRLIP
jgi:hypothetical protein